MEIKGLGRSREILAYLIVTGKRGMQQNQGMIVSDKKVLTYKAMLHNNNI